MATEMSWNHLATYLGCITQPHMIANIMGLEYCRVFLPRPIFWNQSNRALKEPTGHWLLTDLSALSICVLWDIMPDVVFNGCHNVMSYAMIDGCLNLYPWMQECFFPNNFSTHICKFILNLHTKCQTTPHVCVETLPPKEKETGHVPELV